MNDERSEAMLPRTLAVLREGMARGLHVGAQGYVWRGGEVVGDFAIGLGRLEPASAPTTRETLVLWLSACKPVAAVAIAQLVERGRIDFEDPVCQVIPEFAQHQKAGVTIGHLLTHTAGLRYVETGWPEASWARIIERICAMGLESNWTPGSRARYDATTSWFVLGEIVRRVDGRPYEQYVRDEIFLPLGMKDCWIGMPAESMRAYGDRLGVLQATDKPPPRPLAPYDRPEAITHCRPAANGQGPMRELARLYRMLLGGGELDGTRVLSESSVARLTRPQRVGMYDETFRHVIDWGFGFLMDSKKYGYKALPYSFGPHASPRAFGHNGFQSSMVFADPEYDLIVAIAPNGTPGEIAHDRRLRAVLGAVYEDLGFA